MEAHLAALCVKYLASGCHLTFVIIPGRVCLSPVSLFQLTDLLKQPTAEILHDIHLCGASCMIPALYHYLVRATPVHTRLYLQPANARDEARAELFTTLAAAGGTVATAEAAWHALLADPAAQVHTVIAAADCQPHDYAIVCTDARHAAHVNGEGHMVVRPGTGLPAVPSALLCLRCVTNIHDLYTLFLGVHGPLTVIYRPPSKIPWAILQLWRKEEARLFLDRGKTNPFVQAAHHEKSLRKG